MALSDDDLKRIAGRIAVDLTSQKRAQWIDPETHHDHHSWVGMQLKNEAEYTKLRQKVVTSACIWAVPIVMAFLFSAFWREFARLARDVFK